MNNVSLIGIDLGKNSFHVHCQDATGRALNRKKFTRTKLFEFLANSPSTTVVMEACAGAHYMARKISELGHTPKLISPQFVRPFVKSNKNDFVDAEAICEAASRPSMRFVVPRTESQQEILALHRVRESLVRDKVKTTKCMLFCSNLGSVCLKALPCYEGYPSYSRKITCLLIWKNY